MSDDVSDIVTYYDSDPEREHRRLEEHQLEFDLTWRYLAQYLPPHGSLLEVGAATGRYTLALARRGYQVTAVDLAPALLEVARQRLADAGLAQQVRFVVADARDLSPVVQRDYDAVLLMGPLYHLIHEAERQRALRQAVDRLRPGGLVVSGFISRFGVLGDLLRDRPDWIEDQVAVRSMLTTGRRPDEHPRGGFRGYLAHIGELAPLHEAVGFETLTVAGVEPVVAANDESYNRLQGQQRRQWLDLLFELSTETSIIGASRHLLYIGRKP